MKRLIFLLPLLLIFGCTQEPDIGLEVPFHSTGCAGFDETYSDVTITSDGLRVVTNVISPTPCYSLNKAEISRSGDDLTVYFTLSKDNSCVQTCTGVQSFVYTITGQGLNRTGINVEVITYLAGEEIKHSFTS